MGLREYILRDQAEARDTLYDLRRDLRVINALSFSDKVVTVEDVFGPTTSTVDVSDDELIRFKQKASLLTDENGDPLITDWSVVDMHLSTT